MDEGVSGVVTKSSYSDDGIVRLKNEYVGYNWYFNQKKISNNTKLKKMENPNGLYFRLHVNVFSGATGKYYKNISYNRELILRVIDAYIEAWPLPKSDLSAIHGDLSLGNIIFNNDILSIIDWEHFHLDVAPWGFDLVNLLYESIFFTLNGGDVLKERDCQVFKEIRNIISDMLSPETDFKCTLKDLTSFVDDNNFIWGRLVNKLPIMKFSKRQRNYLLEIEKL